MDLSKIKDLTDDQKKAILKEHDLDLLNLKKSNDELLADAKKISDAKKLQDEQFKSDKEKSDSLKMQNATSLEEVKKLLADEKEIRVAMEKRIVDAEKQRVETIDKQTIGSFVDKFITGNVVDDALVRDAIKTKISARLGIRDGKVLEFVGSELTGKTGDQVLSDIRADKGYANHLIANSAVGGGATGGATAGVANKTMTRSEFDSTPPAQVASFIRDGGNVVD